MSGDVQNACGHVCFDNKAAPSIAPIKNSTALMANNIINIINIQYLNFLVLQVIVNDSSSSS
ncbi:hypothetical protein ABTN22_19200, partial [Acinetobacter baumannii]